MYKKQHILLSPLQSISSTVLIPSINRTRRLRSRDTRARKLAQERRIRLSKVATTQTIKRVRDTISSKSRCTGRSIRGCGCKDGAHEARVDDGGSIVESVALEETHSTVSTLNGSILGVSPEVVDGVEEGRAA